MSRHLIRIRRLLPLAAMLAVALAAGACKDFLSVERPTIITEDDIRADSNMRAALIAGAEGEFRAEYAWIAHAGAGQTDEALLSHVWSPWYEYDDRRVTAAGGAYDGISYPFLQRARATGAQFSAALKLALGTRAANDPGYARALAYTGYSHLLIADHLCSIPIDGSAPKSPDEVRQLAIGFFTEAAAVAGAANRKDIADLANVGLARAYLGMNDKPHTIEFASKVTPGFAAWVRYAAHPDFGQWTYYNLYNRVAGMRSPAEFNLGYDPATFATVNDLRVPFEKDSARRLMDGRAPRFAHLPYQPSSFSGWTPGGKHVMAQDAAIRFASALEARYMIAEAGGMSNAALRAFIDERRAVGGHGQFAGTDAQLFDELLEQRRWDFMLAGFRMPDLIRYKRFYQKDLWPSGRMAGFTADFNQNYGTTECWPIGASERNANPNVPRALITNGQYSPLPAPWLGVQ